MKHLSLFLILALLFSLGACSSEHPTEPAPTTMPVEIESDGDESELSAADGLRWSFEGNTLTISGQGHMEDYDFLTTPWDLAGSSFSVEKLVVEEGVVSLGKNAFSACCNLSELSLPSTLKRIGDFCFADCAALRSAVLPEGVLSLGERAFAGSGLTALALPQGLAEIGSSCFANCIDLATLQLPESVLSIGEDAFLGCEKLTVELPRGCAAESLLAGQDITVTTVGAASGSLSWSGEDWKLEKGVLSVSMSGAMPDYAASGAEAAPWHPMRSVIERVELLDGITSVGAYSFWDCPVLMSVHICEDVSSIGDYAFGACPALENITLPAGLKSIGYGGFSYCTALSSLALPEGLESVGADAFVMCISLSELNRPASLKDIGAGAFNFTGENTGELTD